jgi:glycyl-tRNA synthetase beta chain
MGSQPAARDLLFEIGTEELPASACQAVLELLPDRVAQLFASEDIDLDRGALRVLVGPRRIALLVSRLPEAQTPRETAQRGPAAEAAFDAEGRPTQAAAGFARAKGVAPEDLVIREENGRRFVFAVSRSEGRPTLDLLPGILSRLVREMYFPKNMRWGLRDLRFSRPIRWLVALYGDEVVPVQAAGLQAGRTSRGHRWLGGPVDIPRPDAYLQALESVRVLADHEQREAFLRSELQRLAEERGLRWIDPMGKLYEVLYLVEWPSVLAGSFSEDHLRLPDDVLITAMQSHQRYFPLVDAEAALQSAFLFVMNGDPAFAEVITAGNQRVLQGRIEDAEFSFDKDLAAGLEQMAGELDRVVFHEKIGSMKDKTERLVELTRRLSEWLKVPAETQAHALEAARLSKADQVSVMVREFADLEGVMGETYARMEGFPDEVARAISEQFLPEVAGGEVPTTLAGALLATAEKVDNVVAAFAVGEPPSGSKDPYGLRRAAMGMVAIAFRHGLAYDVGALAAAAYDLLGRFPDLARKEEVVDQSTAFIMERLTKFLVDNEVARDAVEAVLPTSAVFADLRKRAVSLEGFRATGAWDDLVTCFTRPSNLAKKLPEEARGPAVEPALFEGEAEKALHEAWSAASSELSKKTAGGDYYEAFATLAELRPAVDRFFDDVLVMAEDEGVRLNRLRLLDAIAGEVRALAHLERLQG